MTVPGPINRSMNNNFIFTAPDLLADPRECPGPAQPADKVTSDKEVHEGSHANLGLLRWPGTGRCTFCCVHLGFPRDLAVAQTSYPMITHVLPAAVQRGAVSEIEVFGQMDFAGTYKAIFEGSGLSAEILKASTNTPAKKGAAASSVKLRLTAARDALPGIRELRLVSSKGVSSVGQLVVVAEPVVQEKGVNNTWAQAQPVHRRQSAVASRLPEDVDCHRFKAKVGPP